MTFRQRVILGYSAMLWLGLMLIAGWAYYELFVENRVVELERGLEEQGNTLLEEIGEVVLFAVVPAFGLSLLGGWLLLERAMAPIRHLSEAAQRVRFEHLAERLPRSGNGDEIDRLTEMFNSMLERLENSVGRVREFTLHASHELKTPLTVMRGGIESLLRMESAPSDCRELLCAQVDEIERLTRIVDSLGLLAKADQGQAQLEQGPVRLEMLVRECFEDALVLGEPHGIQVELARCEEVTVSGDRYRLRQLLLVLLDNAIKFNKPGGRVTLALCARAGRAILSCANAGPGIPAGELPKVFDRFYRGVSTPSQGGETGSGLGLSIAQWIAQAHGGSIRIESIPDEWTTVSVDLPSVRPAEESQSGRA
jgi:signal transduction histidine kinase